MPGQVAPAPVEQDHVGEPLSAANIAMAAAEVLAESLAEHSAYWGSHGKLRPEQERWKAFELEMRENYAAKGEKPTDRIISEIRSGRWEKQQQRSMAELKRQRARLAWLRHEGYTFDADHRLVAPQVATALDTSQCRGSSRERRPQVRRVARSSASRGSSARDDDPEPLAPRSCAGCGETFTSDDPRRSYCAEACRNRTRQKRHKAKVRGAQTAGGIMSAKERDALVRSPTRVPERPVTRLVLGARRFEVSLLATELGNDSRPMNGQPWPRSIAMREVVIKDVEVTRKQERAREELERLMGEAA
jgi:hypothetical protein